MNKLTFYILELNCASQKKIIIQESLFWALTLIIKSIIPFVKKDDYFFNIFLNLED